MSSLITGGVALVYASTVIGLHRLNVRRMRAQASGFPTLDRLDWQSLLAGLLPPSTGNDSSRPSALPQPSTPLLQPSARTASSSPFALTTPSTANGSSTPSAPPPSGTNRSSRPSANDAFSPTALPPLLLGTPPKDAEARHALLTALVQGAPVDPAQFEPAGFSGGESRWLATVALARSRPHDALDRLFSSPPGTSAEVYLREHLFLRHRVHLLNLELAVFAIKRRLSSALGRFADAPTLFFARAQASARLGFNAAVLDDLARAVYYSRNAPFYLRLVTELPWIAEARPALYQQCIQLLNPPSA